MEELEKSRIAINVGPGWTVIENIDHIKPVLHKLFSYTHVFHEFDPRTSRMTTYTFKRSCYDIPKGRNVCVVRSGLYLRLVKYLDQHKIPYVLNIHPLPKTAKVSPRISEEIVKRLRNEQIECLERILKNRMGLIKAPPGFGKSYMLPVISLLFSEAKIDIVTRRLEVIKRIRNAFDEFHVPVGVQCGAIKTTERRVMIISSGLLATKARKKADILIGDECHELATERVRRHLLVYQTSRAYGLSATIGLRSDNADFLLEEIFGPVIYESSYTSSQQSGNVVPIQIIWHEVAAVTDVRSHQGFIVNYKRTYIWRNELRNRKIAEIAEKYLKEGKQVLILVDTVEHMLEIRKFLPQFRLCCRSTDVSRWKYKCQDQETINELESINRNLKHVIEGFRDRKIRGVISTDILSTGVSFEDLEVLIRADGKASKIFSVQAPGRVSRIAKSVNKDVGIVIDFYSRRDLVGLRYAYERYKQYQENGWTQVTESGRPVQEIFKAIRDK